MAYLKDHEIIEALLNGTKRDIEKAVAQLYQDNRKKVTQLVYKRGGKRQDAEDVFQDLMVVFLRNVRNGKFLIQPNTKISTYLYKVAVNIWMKNADGAFLGDQRNTQFVTEMSRMIPKDPDPVEQIILEEEIMGSLDIFKMLSPDDQEFLRACVQEQLTMEQVARKFNLPSADAAKAKKYRIMEKLRELIRRFKK